jgi:hypothetical protein
LYSVDVEFSTTNVSEIFIRRVIATSLPMAPMAIVGVLASSALQRAVGSFQTVSKELS